MSINDFRDDEEVMRGKYRDSEPEVSDGGLAAVMGPETCEFKGCSTHVSPFAHLLDKRLRLVEEAKCERMTFPSASGRYLRYDLIPVDVLTEIVEVFTFGEWKHVEQAKGEGKSWTAGQKYSTRVNKILRHLFDFVRGKRYDDESGRHPLAHAIVQMMMLLGMVMRKYDDFNDLGKMTGHEKSEAPVENDAEKSAAEEMFDMPKETGQETEIE